MALSEKERTVIEDLKTQEKSCIEKYDRYSRQAKDPELQKLFTDLRNQESNHYDKLSKVLENETYDCECNCNNNEGTEYAANPRYKAGEESEDKKNDCFLATDCITSEKLVSSEYNTDVFVFGNPIIRKILASIQIEEQNHAEMLWKYKTANGMA